MADQSQCASPKSHKSPSSDHADDVSPGVKDNISESDASTKVRKRGAEPGDANAALKVPRVESVLSEQNHVTTEHVPELHFAVESIAKHGGLTVPPTATIGDLRRLVTANIKLPPGTRAITLLAGHGGAKLDNDEILVTASPLAASSGKPLVVCPCPGRDEDIVLSFGWCTEKGAATVAGHNARVTKVKCIDPVLPALYEIVFASSTGWSGYIPVHSKGFEGL